MGIGSVARALLVLAGAAALGGSASAALLSNGDFNLAGTEGPAGWESWTYGGTSFAAYKTDPADAFTKDGSPYINAGNYGDWWSSGGGWYQIVPATPGLAYTLDVDCATEGWDGAAGELRLIYLDAASGVIRQDVLHTAEYVAGQDWTAFSLTTIAPDGTVDVKVEFATWGARGTVMWDNAVLSVPEPAAAVSMVAATALLLGSRRRSLSA